MKASNKKNSRRRKSRRCHFNRHTFHLLEDRRMLATFTVTNTSDGVVTAAGDSPGSLRQAIFDANSAVGADTINFDASVFAGGDASLIRLTAGELEITDSLMIDASTGINVTITGDANGDDITLPGNITDVSASYGGTAGAADDLLDDNSRVLTVSSSSSELTLEGLTITGGRTTPSAIADGAGIRSVGILNLTNTTISGNSAANSNFARGGGIWTTNTLTLINSTIYGNSASDDGGGIALLGGSDATLTNSTVSGNTSGDDGGGIFLSSGDLILNNSSVTENTSDDDGGGISVVLQGGSVTLNNSTVSANTALKSITSSDPGEGGGIHLTSGSLSLNNSTVSGNTASHSGGGISSRGGVTMTNSTVSGNTALYSSGGGILAGIEVTLTNSTVSGNSAGESGGGIFVSTNSSNATLINSTVSGNTAIAGDGGGISLLGFNIILDVRNSIFAGNLDTGNAPELDTLSAIFPILSVQNSIIGDTTGTTLTAGNNNQLNVDFTTVLETEVVDGVTVPLLTNNGGPVETIALLANSPAIDAGDNALAVDANGSLLISDQRGEGFDRIFGGTVDIGAIEFAPSAFLLGDTNQDGVVDFADIDSFISALKSGDFLAEADTNGDGVVDFLDIAPFIAILRGS